MPTIDWLKKGFDYGYDSGDVLAATSDPVRQSEEQRIGGSYREVFTKAAIPYLKPDSTVLELGPGKGSWSRAILKFITSGKLHVLDFQDVKPWLKPENYESRLVCHQVSDNSFSAVPDDTFDFFWSFGVLCHNNVGDIRTILKNSLPKMKKGGIAVHQFADWAKLNQFGWKEGGVPEEFRSQPDEKIWWPRNNQDIMAATASEAGWKVLVQDLGVVKRDSVIVLEKK
jgi:hypothetical protein